MHTISKNLYKLAWFLTPIIFLFFLFWKGEFCIMGSCTGNNNVGTVYGLAAVIIYVIILKFIKVMILKQGSFHREFWDVHGIKSGFFFSIVVLLMLLVYFLGKING